MKSIAAATDKALRDAYARAPLLFAPIARRKPLKFYLRGDGMIETRCPCWRCGALAVLSSWLGVSRHGK
jgi:hypothetical protein